MWEKHWWTSVSCIRTRKESKKQSKNKKGMVQIGTCTPALAQVGNKLELLPDRGTF